MIVVQGVSKKYGRKQVLQDVTFTINKGEITCLLGVNGVGKSTLLKAIMNVMPIDSGSITVDDKKVEKAMYNHIVYVPDQQVLPPSFTVKQCFQYMADFYTTWNEERAEEMRQFFKLELIQKVGELSKGNAAKLNMLLGLSLDADYILMDEPFSGIDVFSREQIVEAFTTSLVRDQGVVITTHEIDEIELLVDKVILLDNGRVVRDFYVEDVRQREAKSIRDIMREVYRG